MSLCVFIYCFICSYFRLFFENPLLDYQYEFVCLWLGILSDLIWFFFGHGISTFSASSIHDFDTWLLRIGECAFGPVLLTPCTS